MPKEFEFVNSMFEELKGSRPQGMAGVAEIPFSEFYQYCLMHEFEPAEIREFWKEFHLLDQITVQVLNKIHEEKRPPPAPKKP